MEQIIINWPLVACFTIGFFAISGLFRGWWKEAVTTIVLGFFILLLLNPDWADAFINVINQLIATVWSLIPDGIIVAFNNLFETLFGTSLGTGPVQLDASSAQTWLMILGLSVGFSILLGRAGLGENPSILGRFIGAIVGAVNGFLVLSLTREYLDGRALPGREAPVSEIPVITSNTYGPAATQLGVTITNLPLSTILDSVVPWIVVGIGLLFFFSILKSRIAIDSNKDGSKLRAKLPPFYKKRPEPKTRKQDTTSSLQDIFFGEIQ
jgi:hypothetical protein